MQRDKVISEQCGATWGATGEPCRLIIAQMYEKTLGDKSWWKPYVACSTPVPHHPFVYEFGGIIAEIVADAHTVSPSLFLPRAVSFAAPLRLSLSLSLPLPLSVLPWRVGGNTRTKNKNNIPDPTRTQPIKPFRRAMSCACLSSAYLSSAVGTWTRCLTCRPRPCGGTSKSTPCQPSTEWPFLVLDSVTTVASSHSPRADMARAPGVAWRKKRIRLDLRSPHDNGLPLAGRSSKRSRHRASPTRSSPSRYGRRTYSSRCSPF